MPGKGAVSGTISSGDVPVQAYSGASIRRLDSHYRHAFSNHLQVISGWLHLGQAGRAQEYIGSLQETLDGEQRAVAALGDEAGAAFLAMRAAAELAGVEVVLAAETGSGSLPAPARPVAAALCSLADGATILMARGGARRALVLVGAGEPGGRLTFELDGLRVGEQVAPVGPGLVEALDGALLDAGRPALSATLSGLGAVGGAWRQETGAGATNLTILWPVG